MHAQRLRRLLHAHPAEVAQFDDLRLAWIEPGQFVKRIVQRHQRSRFRRRKDQALIEREHVRAAAALPPAQLARVIHQDMPHQPRGHAQELRPVLPVHLRLVHQLEIGLVHQRGGLQGVALPLHPHVAVGDAPQFPFHLREQPLQTLLVPGPPAEE
jgi:hypothetical protein